MIATTNFSSVDASNNVLKYLQYSNNPTFKCNFSAAAPKLSVPMAILFGLPASVIVLVTIFGNLLVLCFRARVGKRQTTLLIWNLGLADFLVGTVVLPLGVANVVFQHWPFDRFLCKIWTSCDVIFCTASIVTLCVISVDRYIGVTRPLRYKIIVTKFRIIVSIVAIWLLSIGILLVTQKYTTPRVCIDPTVCVVHQQLEYVVHSVISAFFIPASVTLVLYWKIYSVAKRREMGLRQGLMMALGGNFLNTCLSEPLRVHCGRDAVNHQQKVIQMHKRVAKTLGVVVSAFLFCWLPFFTLYLINYHCDCIAAIVLDIFSWMGYCNSMLNPIIYAFTIDEFKLYLKITFRKFLHQPSTIFHNVTNRTHCCDAAMQNNNKAMLAEKRHRETVFSSTTSSKSPSLVDNCDLLHEDNLQQQQNNHIAATQTAATAKLDDEPSENDQWSMKLYSRLINFKSTGL